MRKLVWASGVAVALAAGATTPAQQVDVSKLGPQVGDRVPALGLADHLGRAQTLRSVAGPKGTMLVFFRSADW